MDGCSTDLLHPSNKTMSIMKDFILEQGFKEVGGTRWIDNNLWDAELLFDIPYKFEIDLKNYISSKDLFPDVFENFIKFYEGRKSYCSYSDFNQKESDSLKLIMHATPLLLRHLYNFLSENKSIDFSEFPEQRFFTISRCFRNDEIDETHLKEFHQFEVIIVGQNLGVTHILKLVDDVLKKMGITQVRYRPIRGIDFGINTEVDAYYPKMGRWLELGGIGVLKPDLPLALGLPESITVAGFGISVERITMMMNNMSDIRELLGVKFKFD